MGFSDPRLPGDPRLAGDPRLDGDPRLPGDPRRTGVPGVMDDPRLPTDPVLPGDPDMSSTRTDTKTPRGLTDPRLPGDPRRTGVAGAVDDPRQAGDPRLLGDPRLSTDPRLTTNGFTDPRLPGDPRLPTDARRVDMGFMDPRRTGVSGLTDDPRLPGDPRLTGDPWTPGDVLLDSDLPALPPDGVHVDTATAAKLQAAIDAWKAQPPKALWMLLRGFADKWNMSPTGQLYAYNYLQSLVNGLIKTHNMTAGATQITVATMSEDEFLTKYESWAAAGASRSALFDLADGLQAGFDKAPSGQVPDPLFDKAYILDFLYRMQFWNNFESVVRTAATQDKRDVVIDNSNIDQVVLILRNFYLAGAASAIWPKMFAIFTAANRLTTAQQAYVVGFLLVIAKRKAPAAGVAYATGSQIDQLYSSWTFAGLTDDALYNTVTPAAEDMFPSFANAWVQKAQVLDALSRLLQRRVAAGG